MIHQLLLVLCVFVASNVYAANVNTASTITDVTVYPGAALITRSASIDLLAGSHTVLFNDIVPDIDESTLTVKGQGQASVTIFGASIKRDFSANAVNARVKVLEDQVQSLDDQIQLSQSKQQALVKQQEFLDSIRFKSADQLPKDLVSKMPTPTELEGVGAYLAKGYSDLASQQEELRLAIRGFNKQREVLMRQLQELRGSTANVKRSIAVDLDVVRPGKISLTVSYLVMNVSWTPVYDARVNFDTNNVELALFAQIAQQTGEDWDGANLTISTSRPSIGGQMPELTAWYLAPMPQYPQSVGMSGRADKREMFMAARIMSVDQAFVGEGDLNKGAQELRPAKQAYAEIEAKGVTVVFKVTKPVEIKSDGVSHRVGVTTMTMPVNFMYASTPKLSEFAYLKSTVTNNQEGLLLPGSVNVFLDGAYVGASVIAKTVAAKETFELYMGIDEGVAVTRKLIEQKSDDTIIGNIPSANKTITFSYKITLVNHKNKAVSVDLFDHLPVSQDDKIKVKGVKIIPEPTAKDVHDMAGVLRWQINLNVGEQKEVMMTYSVEYPKNLIITGL